MATTLTAANVAHFDNEAATWEASKPYIREWGVKALAAYDDAGVSFPPDAVFVDFGCGTGVLSEHIAPKVQQVYGLDTSPKMVDAYNAKAATLGLSNKMAAYCLDVTDDTAVASARSSGHLPAPGSASHTSVHMTLHHVEHVPAVLRALRALLRPETGRLLITDILATPESGRFHTHHASHTVAYPGGFEKEQLEGMLAEAGLHLVSFKPDAVLVTKAVHSEARQGNCHNPSAADGVKEMATFPIFLAVAARPSE